MTFKEILKKIGEKQREKKEKLQIAEEDLRIHQQLQERQKSANLRELQSYEKENFEKSVKQKLDAMRKIRRDDIAFNSNPLKIKNITNHTDWEVLKERNMFKERGNMFVNQPFIHKSDANLLNNNKRMFSI